MVLPTGVDEPKATSKMPLRLLEVGREGELLFFIICAETRLSIFYGMIAHVARKCPHLLKYLFYGKEKFHTM